MEKGYNIDWIIKNMGISRKAVYTYEKHGLISPARNKTNNYRIYDEVDLYRIWFIRFLIEWKYSLAEICDIVNELEKDENYDYLATIGPKIQQLEDEKLKLERLIGAAKYAKHTGYIPFPTVMGSEKFDDFVEDIKEYLNVDTDENFKAAYEYTQRRLQKPSDSVDEEDIEYLETMFTQLGWDENALLELAEIITALLAFSDEDPKSENVQKIIRAWHLFYAVHAKDIIPQIIDVDKFVRSQISSFDVNGGDTARLNEKNYGRSFCDFVYKALEYYGSHNDKLIEEES